MVKLPLCRRWPASASSRSTPDEVAARLVELALGQPAGLVPDIAGPKVYAMADLIRGYLRATNQHRPILPIRIPSEASRAFRAGANLAPQHAEGQRTWEDFLSRRLRGAAERLHTTR